MTPHPRRHHVHTLLHRGDGVRRWDPRRPLGTRLRGRAAAAVALLLTVGAAAAGCTVDRTRGDWVPMPIGPAVTPGATTGPAVPAAPDIPGGSSPVADPIYPQYGNPKLDVLNYDLKLRWSPTKKQLTGTATLTIRAVEPVPELVLDFADTLTVDGTTVDGDKATPTQARNDLTVPLAEPLAADEQTTLVVRYHGTPHSVTMPSNRGDADQGLGLRAESDGSAWTMQEPYGAFTWYPVTDQPSDEALYDIAVTVPKGWSGIANGQLTSTTKSANGVTFRWRSIHPVASYLTTLAIGKYKKITDTGPHGLPLTYWLREGEDAAFEQMVRRTPELISWLEKRYGPYPFTSAGVVMVDSTSAMETQQMVTMGAGIAKGLSDPEQINDYMTEVLLHEYAHQWFGDAVTPRDWRSVWLSEGFAMYVEGEWVVDQGFVTRERSIDYLREDDRRSRAEAGPPGHWKADHFAENNIYVGPALLLHEIRDQIHEEAFNALARAWVQTQLNSPVDRETFTAFVEAHTAGRDLTARINLWLDSPTTPGR